MKNRSVRRPVDLSQSRWLAYAAAGLGTAAVGTATAEAEIHYSGHIHLRLTGHKFFSQAKAPLSGGASLAFYRGNSFEEEFDLTKLIGAVSGTGNFRGYDGYHALKLPVGQAVSSGMFTSSGLAALIDISEGGSFNARGVGFVGFKFDVGHGTQYGWVRIKTIEGGADNKIAVEDYAWADPGEPILTGQKAEDQAAQSGHESLGALAFGAAGLMAWRKRRFRE